MLNSFASIERRLGSKNRFFNDYLTTSSSLQDYYRYLPDQIERAMMELPPVKVDIPNLREYNKRLGAPDATLKNIDILLEKGCFVVMSGQQPGLLTGPLFTFYKALHTIRLAHKLSSTYKTDFIPVFWNVSEDHDWNEVNHLYLFEKDAQAKRIDIALDQGVLGSSFARISLHRIGLKDFLREFKDLLLETEFKDDCLRLIDDTLASAENLPDWFSSLLLRLLGCYGLVLFDLTISKEMALPIFRKELEDPLATNRLVSEAGKALIENGYEPQIHKRPNRCSLFLEEDGLRNTLNFEGSLFRTSKKNYSKQELFRILEEEPHRFSPDVALRPILASFLFPVIIYIAGPSEVSYYAQLKEVYARYDLVMPLIIPRVSLSLIEARIAGILSKYSLKPWELKNGIGAIASRLIRENSRLKIGEGFQQVREKLVEILDSLKKKIPHLESDLEKAFDRVKGKIIYEFKGLEDKVIRETKKRETILMDRLKRVRNSLYPNNLPQERVINIFYFLIKYGLGFINQLYESFPLDYTQDHYFSIE